jgi:hypothetical protein
MLGFGGFGLIVSDRGGRGRQEDQRRGSVPARHSRGWQVVVRAEGEEDAVACRKRWKTPRPHGEVRRVTPFPIMPPVTYIWRSVVSLGRCYNMLLYLWFSFTLRTKIKQRKLQTLSLLSMSSIKTRPSPVDSHA